MGTRTYQTVDAAIDAATPAINRISTDVWELAELSLEEVESAKVHIRELESAGFTVTSHGTSGQATAFIAEWTQGANGPRIGFLPEYDALPGLGNAAVANRAPAANDSTNGHGCGHNLLGAGCTGAAIALKTVMEENGQPGTVRVYGCAAEETTGAKVFMARDGLFDDLDACIAWHPGPIAAAGFVRTSAINNVAVEFHGKTAHAGSDPWNGRSAVDALELFCHGINLMREHVKPTVRMHYVIEAGGQTPNVVPDYARLRLFIRDENREGVEHVTQWARELADGAALGTQTKATFSIDFGLYDLLPNTPLVERIYEHLQAVGVPQWSAEEQAFAQKCQRNFGVPEHGMITQVLPMLPDKAEGGASDVGDVSWNAPTALFVYPSFPLHVGLHTWPVTACGGMSIGAKAAIDSARIMARLGADLVADKELRDAARADFEQRRANKTYTSPLESVDLTTRTAEAAAHTPKDGADELVETEQ